MCNYFGKNFEFDAVFLSVVQPNIPISEIYQKSQVFVAKTLIGEEELRAFSEQGRCKSTSRCGYFRGYQSARRRSWRGCNRDSLGTRLGN